MKISVMVMAVATSVLSLLSVALPLLTSASNGITAVQADASEIAIDEQPQPQCVHAQESKGFLQVKNDYSTDVNTKVYWEVLGKPKGDTGCHPVLAGTQHNVGFVGFWPLKKHIVRIVLCAENPPVPETSGERRNCVGTSYPLL